MCIERHLAGPRFDNSEVTWTANLLEKLGAHVAFVLSARVAVLLEGGHRCPFRRGHDVDIGHRKDHGVPRRLRAEYDGTHQKIDQASHRRSPTHAFKPESRQDNTKLRGNTHVPYC